MTAYQAFDQQFENACGVFGAIDAAGTQVGTSRHSWPWACIEPEQRKTYDDQLGCWLWESVLA